VVVVVISVDGSDSESSLGESSPDGALVHAVVIELIGLEDGVTGRDESGLTGLELHAVNNELDRDDVTAQFTVGGGHVEPVGVKSVLFDDIPEHVIEEDGPNLADSVNSPSSRNGFVS